jgi:signal peptidase I
MSSTPPNDNAPITIPSSILWREVLETIILTLLIFWLVNSLTGRFRIEGPSMLPTLHEGEQVLVNKGAYYFDEPQHGDIVVLQSPDDSKNLIKRVIGLPGDVIEIDNRQVLVNGVLLDEPYISEAPTNRNTWVVPEDEVFVMGDNRPVSYDSRSFSYVPLEDVIGKVWVIYWPPEDMQEAPHYDPLISNTLEERWLK